MREAGHHERGRGVRCGHGEGLLAWVGGEPRMAASVKRSVGIRGDLDHDGPWPSSPACSPSCGGAGYAGLVLVLDEVETLQRVRSDARGRALNALRQLIDEVDQGGFPQDTPSVALALAEPVDGWHGSDRPPPLEPGYSADLQVAEPPASEAHLSASRPDSRLRSSSGRRSGAG